MRSRTWASPEDAVADLNVRHADGSFTLRDVAQCDKCARWDNRKDVRDFGAFALCVECYVAYLEGWKVRPRRRQPIGFVPQAEPGFSLLFQP